MRKNNTESSGRWDLPNGSSFEAAVQEQRDRAFEWASGLDSMKLQYMITIMAADCEAFTLYERKALLEVVALKLGREVHANNEN